MKMGAWWYRLGLRQRWGVGCHLLGAVSVAYALVLPYEKSTYWMSPVFEELLGMARFAPLVIREAGESGERGGDALGHGVSLTLVRLSHAPAE